MKLTLLYLLVCLSTQFFKPHADWFTYQTNEASIEFPKEPEITTQTVPTTLGDIELKTAAYEGAKDGDINYAYVFTSSVYPDSTVHSSKAELMPAFFRSSIDGAVKNVNGKLLSEKEVSLKGFPGREATIDYGNGLAIISLRMFLVYNRSFIVQTISETGKEVNDNASRFHKSLTYKISAVKPEANGTGN